MLRLRVRLSGREHKYCAPSTATRLCNKAQVGPKGQPWVAAMGPSNPNGVVAGGDHRRLVLWLPGRNPVGVDGHCRAITQGWRRANPGLCFTTPLGLRFSATCHLILSPVETRLLQSRRTPERH